MGRKDASSRTSATWYRVRPRGHLIEFIRSFTRASNPAATTVPNHRSGTPTEDKRPRSTGPANPCATTRAAATASRTGSPSARAKSLPDPPGSTPNGTGEPASTGSTAATAPSPPHTATAERPAVTAAAAESRQCSGDRVTVTSTARASLRSSAIAAPATRRDKPRPAFGLTSTVTSRSTRPHYGPPVGRNLSVQGRPGHGRRIKDVDRFGRGGWARHDHHRARRVTHHLGRHRVPDDVGHAGPVPPADNQQIGALRLIEQDLRRGTGPAALHHLGLVADRALRLGHRGDQHARRGPGRLDVTSGAVRPGMHDPHRRAARQSLPERPLQRCPTGRRPLDSHYDGRAHTDTPSTASTPRPRHDEARVRR